MRPNDSVADLLSRIRNAQGAGHDIVSVPASKLKIAIIDLLKSEGFIRNFKCIRDKKQGTIKVALRYSDAGLGAIRGIDRISSPGCRVYRAVEKIPYVKSGLGVAILSTSKGVMTDRDCRRLGLGGEHICSVY